MDDLKLKRKFFNSTLDDAINRNFVVELKKSKEEGQGVESKVYLLTAEVALENQIDEGLHNGTIETPRVTIANTFIPALPSQMDEINNLIVMSSNSSFLATVSNLIDLESVPMLVAEPGLQPIRLYFNQLAAIFDGGEDRNKWWDYIAPIFKQIFGDIVHGLIYMNSIGCKGSHLYVGKNGKGKLLPLMDNTATEEADIVDLMDVMVEIITLPFPEKEVDKRYKLPADLDSMFYTITVTALNHVPFYWLINQSYFWSKDEKISFLKDFTTYLKEKVFETQEVDTYLQNASFARSVLRWDSCIDPRVCGGLFLKIFNKPKSRGGIKSYSGKCFVDVVRYCTNCYNHANESTYQLVAASQQTYYSQHDLEGHLSSFFPMLYSDLYFALQSLATTQYPNMTNPKLINAFEHWSRSYFATKD